MLSRADTALTASYKGCWLLMPNARNLIKVWLTLFYPGNCTACSTEHGKCIKGFCECEDGWEGATCEQKGEHWYKKKQILSQGKLLVTQEIAKNHPCNSDRNAKPRCCVFIPNPLSKLFFIYSFLFILNF